MIMTKIKHPELKMATEYYFNKKARESIKEKPKSVIEGANDSDTGYSRRQSQ